jgi:hypothetical protein
VVKHPVGITMSNECEHQQKQIYEGIRKSLCILNGNWFCEKCIKLKLCKRIIMIDNKKREDRKYCNENPPCEYLCPTTGDCLEGTKLIIKKESQ